MWIDIVFLCSVLFLQILLPDSYSFLSNYFFLPGNISTRVAFKFLFFFLLLWNNIFTGLLVLIASHLPHFSPYAIPVRRISEILDHLVCYIFIHNFHIFVHITCILEEKSISAFKIRFSLSSMFIVLFSPLIEFFFPT